MFTIYNFISKWKFIGLFIKLTNKYFFLNKVIFYQLKNHNTKHI